MNRKNIFFFNGTLDSANKFADNIQNFQEKHSISKIELFQLIIKGVSVTGTAPNVIPAATFFFLNLDCNGQPLYSDRKVIRTGTTELDMGIPIPFKNEKTNLFFWDQPLVLFENKIQGADIKSRNLTLKFRNSSADFLSTTTELTSGAEYAVWFYVHE